MGIFDEVLCNHDLFGVRKAETHQTKDLHCLSANTRSRPLAV